MVEKKSQSEGGLLICLFVSCECLYLFVASLFISPIRVELDLSKTNWWLVVSTVLLGSLHHGLTMGPGPLGGGHLNHEINMGRKIHGGSLKSEIHCHVLVFHWRNSKTQNLHQAPFSSTPLDLMSDPRCVPTHPWWDGLAQGFLPRQLAAAWQRVMKPWFES